MPPSRLSGTVLTCIMNDLNAGLTVKAVCRRYHVSPQTVYRWRQKLAAKETSSLTRLRQLQNENRRLKRKVAELSLDYNALRTALITTAKAEC